MKTTIDAINVVYNLLKTFPLPVEKITGNGGGAKEYVVINSLPAQGDEIFQQCYVNVNIHVKDIDIAGGTSVPNVKRLGELASIYGDALEQNSEGDIYLFYVGQGIEREEALKEHYVNIKLLCNLIDM